MRGGELIAEYLIGERVPYYPEPHDPALLTQPAKPRPQPDR
jgi:hypothetical protein